MTSKIYKSAMGKTVDMGSLLLRNENVRAAGNMNVNARGDRLDGKNQVVEQKNRQVQRQYNKQTNVTSGPVTTSTLSAKQAPQTPTVDNLDTFEDLPVDDLADIPEPQVQTQSDAPAVEPSSIPAGGLAAAIARTREVKQELEKTRRQQQQSQGLRKI
jgi:hypothetical protein